MAKERVTYDKQRNIHGESRTNVNCMWYLAITACHTVGESGMNCFLKNKWREQGGSNEDITQDRLRTTYHGLLLRSDPRSPQPTLMR